MDAVASEAGMAKGTLYLYFKSKLEIYIAALQRQIEELDKLTHQKVSETAGSASKLRMFIETRLAYLDAHSDFFKIYQFELNHMFLHPTRTNEAFAEYYRRQVRFLAGLIEDGILAGEFSFDNAEAGAFLVYDAARGVATRRLLGLSKLSLAEDTTMAINFIWTGIGGR